MTSSQSPASLESTERDDLPGMWHSSDLVGGWADTEDEYRVVEVDPDHTCTVPSNRKRRKERIRVIECRCGQRWRWSETYAGDGWVKA